MVDDERRKREEGTEGEEGEDGEEGEGGEGGEGEKEKEKEKDRGITDRNTGNLEKEKGTESGGSSVKWSLRDGRKD